MEELEKYQKEKLTIDLVKANIFGVFIFIPIAIVYGLPFYWIWKDHFKLSQIKGLITLHLPEFPFSGVIYFLIIFTIGIVLHELIHGITWSFFTRNGFKSIKFGVLMKMLTPYCHCKEPLKVSQYILGAIMPAIVLGFVPAVVAIVIGNIPLLLFGSFFTMAAAGDFMIIHLLRNERKDDLVLDHPSEAGCYVYRKIH